MPGDAADRWSPRGGPSGSARRRRSPRLAAPPRRSTPRVPTAWARGWWRRHRPCPPLRRRAGPGSRPARHPTHRSAEPGRRLVGPGGPSAGGRPLRHRRRPRASPAWPRRRCRVAAHLAAPAAAARAAVTTPSCRPRRRLGASGHGRGRRRAGSDPSRYARHAGTRRRAHFVGRPRPAGSVCRAPASDLGPALRWTCRPAPGHRRPAPSASGRPIGPPADPRARARPEPVATRTIPGLRHCPCRPRVAGHRCVDHLPGHGARGRRHGDWWVPWRSGYLCPDEHQRDLMRDEGRPGGRPSSREIRRRPTLPGSLLPSTIGAGGLNFRVRYGNGCDPSAMATETCCQLRSARPGAGPLRTP
jgi:hypothetical protein